MDLPPMLKKGSSPSYPGQKKQGLKVHSLKPRLFEKWKKIGQTGVNQSQIPVSAMTGQMKIIKKYSFQIKKETPNNINLNGSSGSRSRKRQKTVPKTKSVNIIIPKLNQTIQTRKVKKMIQKDKLQNQLKIYSWRMSTHFPVVKVQCVDNRQVKNKLTGQVFQQLQLQISSQQQIQYMLCEIQQFNLLNSIYVINESLVSFQRLFNKFGYFQPTIRMIFITNSFKCKIWVHQNIWQNSPLIPKFISREYQKVQNFYKKIIKLFSSYFQSKMQRQSETQRRSMNLIQKLIYQLEQRKDFLQGMKFINQFLHAYSLKLNNKFLYPIESYDSRSRIFSRLEVSNQALKYQTMGQIGVSTDFLDRQKYIKTLKHSTDRYRQVKQSNCKTIQKTSQFFKLKQIEFKKKSQISICSKQTIVQKKSRFSLHEGNLRLNQGKTSQFKDNLPQFTNQDFNQIMDEDDQYVQEEQDEVIRQTKPSTFITLKRVNDQQDQYEDKIRNQIEKNVRQKNGWLENPYFLLDTDDCAKSIQDSQPSIKVIGRDRALTKLNRIKKSIANSIVEGNNY